MSRDKQELIDVWPFPGNFRITSVVGPREYYLRDEKHNDVHKGFDVAMPIGSDIIMPEKGGIRSGYDPEGFGLFIVLDGEFYRWNFWHLDKLKVASGPVKSSALAAFSGNSGNSTGPHTHMQIALKNQQPGEYIDPFKVFTPRVIAMLKFPDNTDTPIYIDRIIAELEEIKEQRHIENTAFDFRINQIEEEISKIKG